MSQDKTGKLNALGSLRIKEKPGELHIYIDWWQQQSASENTKTVLFAVITVFVGTTIITGIAPRILSGDMRTTVVIVATVLIILFALVGLWTLYTFVATIVNQTELTFTRRKIAMRPTPIPFPNASYEQSLSDIQQITITDAPTRKRGKSGYIVTAITNTDEQLLFTFYDDPAIAERVEQHLSSFLSNKKDITVTRL